MRKELTIALVLITVVIGVIANTVVTKADYDLAFCQFEHNGQIVVKSCESFQDGSIDIITDNTLSVFPIWKWSVPYVTSEGGDSAIKLDCKYTTTKIVNGRHELTAFGCTVEE